ncbi:hypothetical protein [Haloimpatiens massiliensis]|uniref:hypothetical protein n=1 Tax=Haloimpatiens massiliensis TaxID=1658110 RepID=UPI000C8540DC|nr:hypothetical protein [Haloimpatiens massiliensis]
MNYETSIEIVCSSMKNTFKKNNEFIGNVVTLFEEKLSTKEVYFDINIEDDLENFMDYAVMALGEIKYQEKIFLIELRRYTINDNLMLNVNIAVEENYEYIGIDDVIYDLKIEVKNILKEVFVDIYWQQDNHNNEICKDLYGKVYILENQFRQLIIEFMVKKYGYEWNTKLVGKTLKRKIQEYSQWYKERYEEFRDVYIDLFNLQVDDLIKFLESVYEVEQVENEIKEYFINASISNDLVQKGVDKVSETFKMQMSGILQKYSVWNLYIKEILGEDFRTLWLQFSKMRNMVAHNKPICKSLYKDFVGIYSGLNEKFDELKIYIKKNFDITNKEVIDLSSNKRHIEMQNYDEIYREEAGLESLPYDEDEVFEEINDNDSIMELLNEIDEYVSSFKSKTEHLIGYLESIEYNSLDQELRNCIINKILGIEISEIKLDEDWFNDRINSLIDDLNYKFNNSYCSDCFSFGTIAELYGCWNNSLKICVDGDICIEEGHTDELDIKLINEEFIEEGKILRTYGEYSISDYGAAIPEVKDELIIDILDLQKELEEQFRKTISYLDDSICLLEEIS